MTPLLERGDLLCVTHRAAGVGVGKLTKDKTEAVQEFSMGLDERVYYLSGLGCGLRRFAISYVSGEPAKHVNSG